MSNTPSAPVRTLVLALGNPLRGDDGVGAAVLDCLRMCALPPEVEAGLEMKGGKDA